MVQGTEKAMDEELELALKGGDFKRLLDSQLDEVKKRHGLKKVELEVLFYLSRCGESDTPTDVTRGLNLTRGHVSQALDVLLKRKLVTSRADRQDRRITHYSITRKANAIIGELSQIKESMDRQLLAGITEEELAVYKSVMHKMLENIRSLQNK
jgi:DNA-binding MarR family transcriptional regulator